MNSPSNVSKFTSFLTYLTEKQRKCFIENTDYFTNNCLASVNSTFVSWNHSSKKLTEGGVNILKFE